MVLKAIVFDFDGVFTDNRVIISEDGKESVICNRGDGFGLEMIKKAGIQILVLSKERNSVVSVRCHKLGIDCLRGVDDKAAHLLIWLKQNKLVPKDIIYVGNDVNDIDCLKLAGAGIVVADAHKDAKKVADYVLINKGGCGAVREVCEDVLNGMWGKI
jgi:YrbI family 3-deoxy-D-manno-octulosonate 8-phosphate phosphatase